MYTQQCRVRRNELSSALKSRVALVSAICLHLLAGSCGLLKKVEKETSERLQQERGTLVQDSLSLVMQTRRLVFVQQQADSVSSGFLLEIWPKGKFSFSASGVFEGEATKITMRGHNSALTKSFQLRQQDEAKSSLNSLNKKVTSNSKVVEKQLLVKKNPAWKWALVLLLVLICWNLCQSKLLKAFKI